MSSSNTDAKLLHLTRGRLLWILGAYLAIFAVFFWGIRGGVGQYWDWSFPYFGDQMSTFFTNKDASWTSASMGSPLGYSSDYFLRFFISLFGFLPPELLRYSLLVIIFATGALGMYLLAKRHTSSALAFMLGLLVFINPAIFYKYTAGHFNYLVAFTLFIYMLYFLFYKFEKNLRSAVILGLFVAALGVQVQFFVIGGFFLLVFFAFNRDKLGWRYVTVMLGLPLLIHFVWLCNFITGANSTAATSQAAAQVSFKASSTSNFLNIFTFNFSSATLLSKFYAFYELLWNAALFVFLLWLLVREKHKQTFDVLLLVFLAIMIFMATGLYQQINLGPLTVLYPMLREVGHFAPIIVLTVALLVARLVRTSTWRWSLMCVLGIAMVIVGIKFQYYSQGYSFATARQDFAPFKAIADSDTSNYRILTYPFFDKYSFNFLPTDNSDDFPLKNSGHDSFSTFSKQAYIQNAIAPNNFQTSVQYQLLQTYDISVLRPYNVKYIFDFSSFYQSNYDRYVPATTYNNDLSLIKNDPHFLDKLLARNPGKLRRINSHVLEVVQPVPHVQTTASVLNFQSSDDAQAASTFVGQALHKPLDYVTDATKAAQTTSVTPLFADPTQSSVDKQSGSFSQTVASSKGQAALYVNTSYVSLLYQISHNLLTLYTDNAGDLVLNNQALASNTAGRKVLTQMRLTPGQQYYLSFNGSILPLKTGDVERAGVGKAGDSFSLLTADGSNLISNGSFEQKLWEQQVGDCNNYDGNPDLGMQRTTQTASSGKASLELSATRHDACTSTDLKLTGNTNYLLSFDYQSPNAQTASFFLSYSQDDLSYAKGFRAINDNQWHNLTQQITTPAQPGNARLYLYALEGDGKTATVNHYDNVSLVKLRDYQDGQLPAQANPYKKIDLPAGQQQFTYKDTGYQYQNLLANPSFERGPWQKNVTDCNNYDGAAKIGMYIDQHDASNGTQSLALEATHHDACTRTSVTVTPNKDYLLSFDYKTNGAKYYGYAASFDDPQTTVTREQLTAGKTSGWQHATIKVHAPANTSTMTLYLYAFEGQGRTNIVHYDNVSVAQLPDFSDRFYVVQQPSQNLQAPKSTSFSGQYAFEKTIHIQGATSPFFVSLSETYHPKWRLELDNGAVNGMQRWSPTAAGTTVSDHFMMSNFANGWLVDPAKICLQGDKLRSGCQRNSDGSYNIALIAEFVPQRWFTYGSLISWLTLITSVIYLTASRGQIMPTYQLSPKQWRHFMRRSK
jgi:Carbohydrate binding domain